jgi:hypothetical protein
LPALLGFRPKAEISDSLSNVEEQTLDRSPHRFMVSIGDENAACAPARLEQGECAMQRRRRFTQTESLKDRLAAFAKTTRERAEQLSGPARDALLRKARQADTAAQLDDWATPQAQQPPK